MTPRRLEWPAGGGPYTQDGRMPVPADTPLLEARDILRQQLALGHTLGMRDAAGRLVSVAPGIGVVGNEVIDLSGLTAATVFSPAHARTMALLWELAAERAEQRERAGR